MGEKPSTDALEFGHGARLRYDARAGESVAERALEGGSERYLGDENQDLFPAGEDLGDQLQIDLGLAAARDAKEQAHSKFLQPCAQSADSLLLLRSQLVRVDETGLGPLGLHGNDPALFNAVPQQVSAPRPLRVELGIGCPTSRQPLQQRAQAPVPRRSRRKRFPADRGEGVIARGGGHGLGGAQSRR